MRPIATLLILLLLTACTVYRNDGPAPKKSDQVYVCHKGKQLRLDDQAVRAHLNHGDTLGTCGSD